jgi:hypothetical protein
VHYAFTISRPATDEELLLAHDGSYLDVMKKINTVMHETSGSVRASPRSQKALSDQAVKMQLIEQVPGICSLFIGERSFFAMQTTI